ncbi:MAG: aminotransferase class V-fold PLP-dependent enzyme [candidate division WOR-3 bacterium]|nr:MAG: aminotransferase class V-fold PLP-dependent enzyme [candidate division WOR-3 bacterium]
MSGDRPAVGSAAKPGRAFDDLERSIRAALARYSNVHRGTGHSSIITTALYEVARLVVLEHLGLDPDGHTVVFCSPRRLALLLGHVRKPERVRVVSSRELGLPLGLRAAAVRKGALPRGRPFETGGGTIRMVSRRSVAWATPPELFEPGTPNIIGAITLARALQLTDSYGAGAFCSDPSICSESELFVLGGLEGLTGRPALLKLRRSLVGFGLTVPTECGELPGINFDNGASTPTFEPIWQTACRAWRLPGDRWPAAVARVRRICADFFEAPEAGYDVVFASSTTEAINVVMEMVSAGFGRSEETVVLNTLLEHNSNELPWRYCPRAGLIRLPVDAEGFMDLARLEAVLREYNRDVRHGRKRIRLVAACGASNVTGTYNDIARLVGVAHRYDARVLVDAAQLAAHRPIRMREWNVDLLAFSGHKMYAPFGSGGVIARKGLIDLADPRFDRAVKSGEENITGIAALGMAIRLLRQVGLDTIAEEEQRLTAAVLEGLSSRQDVRVYGDADPDPERLRRRGAVVCFESRRLPHNLLAKRLGESGGIGVRNGCFCANMYVKSLLGVTAVMDTVGHFGLALAPGLMEKLLVGLVRVSFGIENTEEEIARLLQTLDRIGQKSVSRADRLLARLHLGTPAVPRTVIERQIDDLVDQHIGRVYTADSVRFVSGTARAAGHGAKG